MDLIEKIVINTGGNTMLPTIGGKKIITTCEKNKNIVNLARLDKTVNVTANCGNNFRCVSHFDLQLG